jgi:tetratricopeptide (TPR) repeat protein
VYLTAEFTKQIANSPVFSSLNPPLSPVSFGLLFKFSNSTRFLEDGSPEFNFKLTNGPITNSAEEDPFYLLIMNVYNNGFLNRANYLMQFAKYEEAEKLITKALQIFPNDERSKQILYDVTRYKRTGTVSPNNK